MRTLSTSRNLPGIESSRRRPPGTATSAYPPRWNSARHQAVRVFLADAWKFTQRRQPQSGMLSELNDPFEFRFAIREVESPVVADFDPAIFGISQGTPVFFTAGALPFPVLS